MDLIFCHVLAGQEGSVHNDCILKDTLFNNNFTILDNKCYLANAGYHNTDYLLYFYRRVHYHLKRVFLVEKKPTTQEELFNFCYSNLQNMVEQIFGVTKRQFQIFKHDSEYSFIYKVVLYLLLLYCIILFKTINCKKISMIEKKNWPKKKGDQV